MCVCLFVACSAHFLFLFWFERGVLFILLSDLFFLDMSVLKDIESVLTDYVKEYQGIYIYKVNKEIL